MDPFKRARTPAEHRRYLTEAGQQPQPCMLCQAQHAPHCRDITLIREDGAQCVIVARFCARCHQRPDRAAQTRAILERLTGAPIVPGERPKQPRRN